MFRIRWGQTDVMQVANGDGRGYIDFLTGFGQPCWIIQQWEPPEKFGMPATYYRRNREETGLCMTGEYPHRGRYKTLQPLMLKRFDETNNQLVFETLPLDWEIIERVVPVLIQALGASEEEVERAYQQQQADDNAELIEKIADELYDRLPTFYGPTSYADQAVRTSVIQRKMDQIEKVWKQQSKEHRPMRGFYQGR